MLSYGLHYVVFIEQLESSVCPLSSIVDICKIHNIVQEIVCQLGIKQYEEESMLKKIRMFHLVN